MSHGYTNNMDLNITKYVLVCVCVHGVQEHFKKKFKQE